MRRVTHRAATSAGVVAAIVVGALFLSWPRGSTPVSVDDAVENFRASTATAPTATTRISESRYPRSGDALRRPPTGAPAVPTVDPLTAAHNRASATKAIPSGHQTNARLPGDGVYTFDATGSERVQLGPFPAEDRSHPDRVPVTVVTDANCFTVTVDYSDQHSEDTAYCTGGDGQLHLTGRNKRQAVGAMRPTGEMSCDPDVIYRPGARGEIHCELTMTNGPAVQRATLTGTFRSVESQTVTVAGVPIDARQIILHYDVSGDLSGSWDETLWLDTADWTPLRIERHIDLRGAASFTEESDLHLADRTSRR